METATLQLPKDLIEGAIKQHVQIAMAAALGDKARILETAVAQVLSQKVDSDGKPCTYSSSTEFIQWAVRDSLTKAVKETISVELAKHQDLIRKHIVDALQRKNSPLLKQMADAMVGGLIKATDDKWKFTVTYGESR